MKHGPTAAQAEIVDKLEDLWLEVQAACEKGLANAQLPPTPTTIALDAQLQAEVALLKGEIMVLGEQLAATTAVKH